MSAAEQKLVDAVALAMRRAPSFSPDVIPYDDPPYAEEWMRIQWWDDRARAAIAAVHEHEVCAGCGCKLKAPAMCPECASAEGKNTQPGQ